MLNDEKISSTQLMFLLVTLVTATAWLFVPAITAEVAAMDGWISLLVPATVYGVAVVLACVALGLRFPGRTVIEYSGDIVGSFLGKIIGLGYIFFFLHINGVIIREFGDFVVTAFMPETPLLLFNGVMVLLAAYAVRCGMEVICRANQFVFPLAVLSLFVIIGLVAPEMRLENLLPVFDRGLKPILGGALEPSSWRGEVVVLLMFLPYLNSPREARKAGIGAVVFIGILLALDTASMMAVFGPEMSAHLTFPTLYLARYVSVGQFVERTEAIVMILWVTGIFIKVACFYQAGTLAAAQWFGLADYRPLVLPLGAVQLVWSVTLFESSRELIAFLDKSFPPYAYIFELGLPLLLLLVALFRKKGVAGNAQKTGPHN